VTGVRLSGRLVCATQEQVDAVEQHLPEHVALTRAEPGCQRFEVVPLGDGLTWQVDEAFSSSAAFRAHQLRVAGSAWGRATAGFERRYAVEGLDG
jgi:quinol monooxygenase YgiN